jgi:hypothetical protein
MCNNGHWEKTLCCNCKFFMVTKLNKTNTITWSNHNISPSSSSTVTTTTFTTPNISHIVSIKLDLSIRNIFRRVEWEWRLRPIILYELTLINVMFMTSKLLSFVKARGGHEYYWMVICKVKTFNATGSH